MKRKCTVTCMLFLILMNFHVVFAEKQNRTLTLDELIEEAVQNNPELKVFEETVNVFKERLPQAKSLDNPRLQLSIMNLPVDTFRFSQEAMTQKQVSIMQKFPFPGKLELKESLAEKEVGISQEEFREKKNSVIMQVKVVYNSLLFITRAIEITQEERNLLREFIKIAETKYEVGKGLQQDVLKAQVELSKMTDRLISLEQKRQSAFAHLNTLLNRPLNMPFSVSGQLSHTRFNLTFKELQKIADENGPLLGVLKYKVERYRLSQRLAEKGYYPDIDVGLSYGQRDDDPMQERADFLSGFATINIPLWYKNKESRKVAEQEANVRKAVEQLNAQKNKIYFQIKEILLEIEKYRQEIELFKTGLIPQSTLSLESALSGYKVNKVDFLTLVNNQITLYSYEIDYYRVLKDYENKLAELEAAVGKRLF